MPHKQNPGAFNTASNVAELQAHYAMADPLTILRAAHALFGDRLALVSSFGAEAAVLLHMAAQVDRDMTVFLADTLMLFPETLEYQRDLTTRLGLRNVQHITPDTQDLKRLDPDNILHQSDPDACCVIRKVAPLDRALQGYEAVLSGRKRYQSETRSDLSEFEFDGRRTKINPLAHWSAHALAQYRKTYGLPAHPLVARGYPSIGCLPCTSRVGPGETARAGRWRGSEKTECGIHFGDGAKPVRRSEGVSL